MPITVRIGDSDLKIQNFEYADPWDGPRIRYLSLARHSETLRQFDLSLKRPLLLDEHLVSASLQDIEDELEAAALDRSVPRLHRTSDLLKEMTFPNHLLWLEQCRVQSPASHPCCMERAWEKWGIHAAQASKPMKSSSGSRLQACKWGSLTSISCPMARLISSWRCRSATPPCCMYSTDLKLCEFPK